MSRGRRGMKKMQATKLVEMSETIVENITVKTDVKEDDLQQSWSLKWCTVEEADGCC